MTQEQSEAIERIGKELSLLFPCMHGTIGFNINPDVPEVRVKFVKDIRFEEKKR